MPELHSNPPNVPTVADRRGRSLRLHTYSSLSERDIDDLVGMYVRFGPDGRAMGIPPVGTDRIRGWLDRVDGLHTVARHDGRAVGHAMLVPDGPDERELAVFVAPEYRHAGVGTLLLDALLATGERAGVGTVWLLVEPDNRPAVALYRSVGFEPTDREGFELEMRLPLPREGPEPDGGRVADGSLAAGGR